ncbi:neopullulanase [Lachnospiraceae bacterium KM106-2]|nr:neopullulanase [Lachnospiraceae bacterium KM106-2]
MNIKAVSHIPKSNYAFAYNSSELHIRLRTAKDDMDEVRLFYGMKYEWDKKRLATMEKILSDGLYDYYEYKVKCPDSRIGYYFELQKGKEVLCYTETGFVEEFDDKMAYCYFFQYPYVNANDVHRVPDWIHSTTFYQIFVERFFNGDVKNSPSPLTPWEEEPTPTSFYGGDLKGIITKMDYLVELGISGIYLTPIFESVSNHKYDIKDYKRIDPFFGTEDDLRTLIERAHSHGIKIVLDAVFNHCSSEFPPFMDVIKKGKQSKYWNWFFVEGDKVNLAKPNYKMFAFVPYMPKLNTANEEVRDYLYEVITYWTSEFAIDGWRLDVSDEIDHEFWRGMRKLVKEINPEAILIGENWHDAYPWLKGDQFDSVMNYPLTKLSLDYFARKIITAKEFSEGLATLLMRYSDQVNEAMLNLLDSHDTERFLTTCKENKKSLMNAAAFLYGYLGMPCTYYGTEIGMDGVYDPGCRKGFEWNQKHWDVTLYQFYKKLIHIRNEEKVLQDGGIRFYSSEQVFVMMRENSEDRIYILINNTEEEQVFDCEKLKPGTYLELFHGEKISVSRNTKISLTGESTLYLKVTHK